MRKPRGFTFSRVRRATLLPSGVPSVLSCHGSTRWLFIGAVMFTLSMQSNIAAATAEVRGTREQIALATAKALTFTAERVRDAEKQEMQRVFDRPTAFTLNSLYLRGATPFRLEAKVWFKDLRFRQHYLVPQIHGGDRPLTRFEQYLQKAGKLPVGMMAVPGAAARLDGFGNMSRGQIVQVLSALQALPEAGYLANKSRRKGARRNRVTDLIFVGRPHPGWPAGVWQRQGLARLKPILIFVRAPRYTQRFDFYGLANKIADREFPAMLNRELQRASTASTLAAAA